MTVDLFDTQNDINYMSAFIEYFTMKFKKHISEKICQKKKAGNSNKTFPDQNG
jgi:hypothetical protein